VNCVAGRVPYAEQLVQKREYLSQRLRRLNTELRETFAPGPIPVWLQSCATHTQSTHTIMSVLTAAVCVGSVPAGGDVCELEPVRPSPVLTGYRNKCEFSIGRDRDGKICVGCGSALSLVSARMSQSRSQVQSGSVSRGCRCRGRASLSVSRSAAHRLTL
jgi:tRNA/tmRNA/rRNA uracil-C5-methylase (TrmA/RlmC/RlmD family)